MEETADLSCLMHNLRSGVYYFFFGESEGAGGGGGALVFQTKREEGPPDLRLPYARLHTVKTP